MDEYQLEIQAARRTLARLKSEKADESLIEEHEAQLRNLVALYDAAVHAYNEGRDDRRLAEALLVLGFGEWTFANVYSFVYDAALETETEDGRDLANIITHTDYAHALLTALEI
ncbi:MAG: hypothetical protein NVSMB29_19930 [Candidatus Dormibacteria bacterium]